MSKEGSRTLPAWLFTLLAAGGFWASGIYLGMIRAEGGSAGLIVRTTAFGVFGALMLWGALAKRK